MKLVLVVAGLFAVTQATYVLPLHKRVVPVEEQQQILQLLQLSEEDDDDQELVSSKAPNVLLNSNFFGNIEIGKNKQEFEVVFDTGSSVLWVYSEKCASCKTSPKHTFVPAKSTTFKTRDIPFSIRYGTGESKGTTGVDQIFIADLEVAEQPFGQCEQPDDVMRGFPFDGIVGLSRALVSDPNAMPTIINTIKEKRILEDKNLANTFSFYIGREAQDPTYLIFGGSHEMLEDEKTIHWTGTLNKNIYWEVPLDDIFIHHKEPSTETRHPTHHYLEQHPHLVMHNDPYAAMRADPELSLLELETLLSKSKPHSEKKHAHSNKKHATAKKDFEEEHINVLAHTPNQRRKSVSPEAENENDAVGSGQLISNFHKPGTSMNPCKQDDLHMCIISVDSGHSLMSGPPDIVRPIKAQLTPKVTDQGCTENVMAELPDLSFAIGGKLFTMTPTDYLIELDGHCVPALSERNTRNGHDWVLGEHFMRTFYTVFDYDNMRVGLAHLDTMQSHLPKVMRTHATANEKA